ncbi:hypothetical protein EG329_001335 [Mollisiaceae sp. DMI_Dod_QoI]|nr:hypothetical protein EG329_001335 [Helotiales sp. DMI_Dod_QoI]
MVVVQTNGPIDTTGSLGVLGRIEIDGKVVPREDAEVLDSSEVGVAVELVVMPDVACRALTLAVFDVVNDDDGKARVVGSAAEVKAARVLEEKAEVAVEDGTASGTEVGISTGQKDQTFLPSFQYKSISNRRKPEASRFEKQSAELSSSNRRVGKHAALKDTPGLVA